jgi:hypothetical protein
MVALSTTQLLTLLGCGVGAGYSLTQIVMAVRASRWPSVEGEIASACLVRTETPSTDPEEYVAYRNTVGGLPYRNDRLCFGPQVMAPSPVPQFNVKSASQSGQAALEHQYPKGQPVRVYYNPDHPEQSVLSLMPSIMVWAILVAAGVFAYATLYGHR